MRGTSDPPKWADHIVSVSLPHCCPCWQFVAPLLPYFCYGFCLSFCLSFYLAFCIAFASISPLLLPQPLPQLLPHPLPRFGHSFCPSCPSFCLSFCIIFCLGCNFRAAMAHVYQCMLCGLQWTSPDQNTTQCDEDRVSAIPCRK